MHAGMSYRRLEEMGGIQWPCYDESHPGEIFLHGRLWSDPLIGPRAPFSMVEFEPPVDQLDEQYPIRLTTGRRLDDYNTGVQTREYASPLRRKETLDISPEDGEHYQLREGEKARVTSRRGSLVPFAGAIVGALVVLWVMQNLMLVASASEGRIERSAAR